MTNLVFIVLLVFLVIMLLERRKKQNILPKGEAPEVAADELGPSRTGRFRVAQMFASTQKQVGELPKHKADEVEPLPDPLSDDKKP